MANRLRFNTKRHTESFKTIYARQRFAEVVPKVKLPCHITRTRRVTDSELDLDSYKRQKRVPVSLRDLHRCGLGNEIIHSKQMAYPNPRPTFTPYSRFSPTR